MRIWASVYYYVVLATIFLLVFFSSPAKSWLVRQRYVSRTEDREQDASIQSFQSHNIGAPLLGLPDDPETLVADVVTTSAQEDQ